MTRWSWSTPGWRRCTRARTRRRCRCPGCAHPGRGKLTEEEHAEADPLDVALAKIRKEHGGAVIRRLGEEARAGVEVILHWIDCAG